MNGDDKGEFSKDRLLRSWKEISAYLGCDVRTCHRWEDERGMPVHRSETGKKKSPVFAYRDELDAWFRETFRSSSEMTSAGSRAGNGGSGTKEERGSRRPWLKWAAVGAAVLVLAGAGAFLLFAPHRQPADFAIEGPFFVALDKHKRELWRKDMKVEDLRPEEFYRIRFQVPRLGQEDLLPSLVMKDINGDGDTEVLFALRRAMDQTGEGVLFCWDRRGTELWKFAPDRELVCGGKRYSPDYRITGFYLHDIDGDGRLEIAVESTQSPDWPCQLSLLDSSGKMIGEFWNAGYLKDLAYHDIDGDGREELIVCGLDNEGRGGCLIVFDPRDIRGASPQGGKFACQGMEPGSMLYYLTVPYADVSDAKGIFVEGFWSLEITKSRWIQATTSNNLIYEFDFSLRCVQVRPGHAYELSHGDMVKAGKITSVLGEAYMNTFRSGVRYWDGKAWTSEPTPVKR